MATEVLQSVDGAQADFGSPPIEMTELVLPVNGAAPTITWKLLGDPQLGLLVNGQEMEILGFTNEVILGLYHVVGEVLTQVVKIMVGETEGELLLTDADHQTRLQATFSGDEDGHFDLRDAVRQRLLAEYTAALTRLQILHANGDSVFRAERDGTDVTVAVDGTIGTALQLTDDEGATTLDIGVTTLALTLNGLPTADPVVAGRVWNDAGTLKVSAG